MTIGRDEDKPRINYIWVGPPKSDSSGKNSLESDVKDVINMAKNCKNDICYYCLDEYANSYGELFKAQGVNVEVRSIDAFLIKMLTHENQELQRFAGKMIEMKEELLKPPRDRIIDRVSFKDAFALFILSCEGGYMIDTNINLKEGTTGFSFPHWDNFKVPGNWDTYGPKRATGCWMLYAPPNDKNEAAITTLDNYFMLYEHAQKIIKNNERNIFSLQPYHDAISYAMINSIETTLNMTLHLTNEQALFKSRFYPGGADVEVLPLVKTFENSHRPAFEMQQIVLADVKEYLNQTSAINGEQKKLLNSIQDICANLSSYASKRDQTIIIEKSYTLSNILASIKKLDDAVNKAMTSSHRDSDKPGVAEVITFAYRSLNNILERKQALVPQDAEEVIKVLNEKIDSILHAKVQSSIPRTHSVLFRSGDKNKADTAAVHDLDQTSHSIK